MRVLAGLVSTTGGDGSLMRLHPLIKGSCERRRFEETPERFRTIHCGIAQALARRGRVVEALRQAAAAGDPAVLARIAESTRGVRLWLEQGLEGLRGRRAADRRGAVAVPALGAGSLRGADGNSVCVEVAAPAPCFPSGPRTSDPGVKVRASCSRPAALTERAWS